MEDDWDYYIQYPPVYGIEVDETENTNPILYLPDGTAIQRRKQIGFIWNE